ncbi:MAG: hypothetical protein A3K59_01115 [Euryarchaeota archaeon RBG_19FT_COMBO_69_17]|nr:MAG: hypothetical protein A3K59_01115 [Euryarchaeota archaeon RBG_19FT_COMBO_69_17]
MRVLVGLVPERTEREVVLPDRATGLELLRVLGRAPDVHILTRGDTPVPLDTPLEDGERVRVISVVSGGLA